MKKEREYQKQIEKRQKLVEIDRKKLQKLQKNKICRNKGFQ